MSDPLVRHISDRRGCERSVAPIATSSKVVRLHQQIKEMAGKLDAGVSILVSDNCSHYKTLLETFSGLGALPQVPCHRFEPHFALAPETNGFNAHD